MTEAEKDIHKLGLKDLTDSQTIRLCLKNVRGFREKQRRKAPPDRMHAGRHIESVYEVTGKHQGSVDEQAWSKAGPLARRKKNISPIRKDSTT